MSAFGVADNWQNTQVGLMPRSDIAASFSGMAIGIAFGVVKGAPS
jgi:hypothetical protein